MAEARILPQNINNHGRFRPKQGFQPDDQGLVPFKMLYFNDGVNLSLGLPFIRTSADHGTAFDISEKFIADSGSMTAAIKLALELSDN